jgi:hypothetical protein
MAKHWACTLGQLRMMSTFLALHVVEEMRLVIMQAPVFAAYKCLLATHMHRTHARQHWPSVAALGRIWPAFVCERVQLLVDMTGPVLTSDLLLTVLRIDALRHQRGADRDDECQSPGDPCVILGGDHAQRWGARDNRVPNAMFTSKCAPTTHGA